MSMTCRRLLSIQDISCLGQCSLTVALPILSAAGHETCILPSAVLSTHTGGFQGNTFRDLTEDMPLIAAHWLREKIRFDAICTGYLGSAAQIRHVLDIFRTLKGDPCVTFVDPAMADGGRLYRGFDMAFVKAMKELVLQADIILPNITEACLLTGETYRETCDPAFVHRLIRSLREQGAGTIVLTGVSYQENRTGVMVLEGETEFLYEHPLLPRLCHGTGDIFAAAFAGACMRGIPVKDSAILAADFTLRCVERTMNDPAHWYGVHFEAELPRYIQSLTGSKN